MRTPRFVFVMALVVALLTGVTACGSDEVAARVNGEEISVAELDEQVDRLREQSPQMFESEEGEAMVLDFKRRLLESMIDFILIRQAAEDRGITVSDEELDTQIDELKSGFGSEDDFNLALADAGLTMDDLRQQLRDQVVTQRLMEELVGDEEVTDEEIAQYYEENEAEFAEPASTRASHILFDPADKALAEEVLAEIRGGADFAELAREHSKDPGSASQGGDLDWSDPARPFVPEFTETMESLEVGEVSDLVESDFGWHIIKVDDRREARQKPLADASETIETSILQSRNAEAYQEFLEGVRADATIEILIDDLKPATGE